jgi:excinuclease UvrABC nuclease subunit
MIKSAAFEYEPGGNIAEIISGLEKEMMTAADNLNFELAAVLRDKIKELKEMRLEGKKSSKRPARKT